ncbi:MAG: DUF92 domain-containing protein [Ferruginibacter sp.]
MFNISTYYLLLLLTLLAILFITVKTNKLTPAGAILGGVIATCIYGGAMFTGIAMLGLFFCLGTFATSWKINTKKIIGVAENSEGRRTAMQVVANGGVAALAGLLSCFFPVHEDLFRGAMAAAFASATADTLSSELGIVYGKKFYNILSFKKDRRGENGVVSLEGTAFGLAGSAIIATVYCIGFGWGYQFTWIIIAGTAGNIADSLMGATLERGRYFSNDMVNVCNTLTGALCYWIIQKIFTW